MTVEFSRREAQVYLPAFALWVVSLLAIFIRAAARGTTTDSGLAGMFAFAVMVIAAAVMAGVAVRLDQRANMRTASDVPDPFGGRNVIQMLAEVSAVWVLLLTGQTVRRAIKRARR